MKVSDTNSTFQDIPIQFLNSEENDFKVYIYKYRIPRKESLGNSRTFPANNFQLMTIPRNITNKSLLWVTQRWQNSKKHRQAGWGLVRRPTHPVPFEVSSPNLAPRRSVLTPRCLQVFCRRTICFLQILWPKLTLGRKGLFYITLRVITPSQRKAGAGTEAKDSSYCLLTWLSHGLLNLLSYIPQDHQLRGGIIPSGSWLGRSLHRSIN